MENKYLVVTWDWKETPPSSFINDLFTDIKEVYGDAKIYDVNNKTDDNVVIISNVLDLTRQKIEDIWEQYYNRESDEFVYIDNELNSDTYNEAYNIWFLTQIKTFELNTLKNNLNKVLNLDDNKRVDEYMCDIIKRNTHDEFKQYLKSNNIKIKNYI